MKLRILRAIADSVKKNDPYSEAEVKARAVMRKLHEAGEISAWDIKSDPNSTDVAIWWVSGSSRIRPSKIKIDLKNIDKNLLSIMEVLET